MTIRMLVMDVDGTLTDGRIHIGADGELFKSFDVKDGYGIKQICKKYGIITVIITGRESKIVEIRSNELEIDEVHQAVSDKKSVLIALSSKYGLKPIQIAYVGDDLNDLSAIEYVGTSFAPSDSHPKVKERVNHVLHSAGGHGAVRECIDIIIDDIENPKTN
ncbi:MAG: HAD hydrolase family protein [Thermoplasmatales archaeon]|nr:HAD hydrolase family protein [Thermoplasmatales archaeon]